MDLINWIEQDKFFGLDFSTKKGKFKDYEFDIRYDYDGKPNIKPENCGLCLVIYKNRSKV